MGANSRKGQSGSRRSLFLVKSFTSVSSPSLMWCQVTQRAKKRQSIMWHLQKEAASNADRLINKAKKGPGEVTVEIDATQITFYDRSGGKYRSGSSFWEKKKKKPNKMSHICRSVLWQHCVTWTSGGGKWKQSSGSRDENKSFHSNINISD